MIRGTIRRLRAMDSEELRFRVTCEARKAAGRLASAVSRPAWRRETLGSILSPDTGSEAWSGVRRSAKRGDFVAAHAALAEHFSARRSAFAINARDVAAVTAAIRRTFPHASAEAATRGDRIISGRYDLLGYSDLPLGAMPGWHRDPVNQLSSPVMYWASVPYLNPSAGDHKVIWEINRHQHWLALGRAHALTGEHRYREAFVAQLSDWLRANPPLMGTNWASMLELGFRSLSWLWALELFAAGAADDREPWLVDLLVALDRQLTHVEQNLSHYFSPNTHLSGEALALYVAGCALPELASSRRRAELGRKVLVREATKQIRADGGHVELSTHYQRYSTDFYLLAARVARRASDPAEGVFAEAALRQARFLRQICDDRGERPAIGDDDGGQLFPICGRPSSDCRDTLASAAVLLDQPALAIDGVPEESYWLCGLDAAAAPAIERVPWPSVALTASGYYVSRNNRGDHLVFDAGPHGFLNGGHAHADALSCTLTIAGRPVLIDPGTATYTMDAALRDRFRGTAMHNTVVIGGRPQSIPRGAFHWKTTTAAEAPVWHSATDCDYVEGTHGSYAPARHTRAILALHGVGWWILDHVLGAGADDTVDQYWHLHPSLRASIEGRHLCRLRRGDETLALASTAALTLLPEQHDLAAHSPGYGAIEPAPTVTGTARVNGAATLATFIPAVTAIAQRLQIEEVALDERPGDGWHGCAFRARWQGGAMMLLAAIENTGVAGGETNGPAMRWGTAELQTDARVAALIDCAGQRSEAVLVNGRMVSSAQDEHLISLPQRVPLLRLPSGMLAPTVHEVVT